jgi:predicted DCC family thiol-disulfide oxidoreductase YuxK
LVTGIHHKQHILFYDGTCKFCDRMVQLGLRHDRARRWRYSPLQSEFAARELARFGIDAATTDSIHALVNDTDDSSGMGAIAREHLLSSSDAGVLFWRTLSGWPRLVGALLTITPRCLREPAYRLIARNRYRWFGRYDVCKLPTPEQAALFIWE